MKVISKVISVINVVAYIFHLCYKIFTFFKIEYELKYEFCKIGSGEYEASLI